MLQFTNTTIHTNLPDSKRKNIFIRIYLSVIGLLATLVHHEANKSTLYRCLDTNALFYTRSLRPITQRTKYTFVDYTFVVVHLLSYVGQESAFDGIATRQ